jgi:hypothetical protein
MNVWNSTYEANSISVHDASQYITILPNTSVKLGATATFELGTTCENGYSDYKNSDEITPRTLMKNNEKIIEINDELYPNPSESGGIVHLNSNELINSISIYTIYGQLIRAESVNAYNYNISINNIPPGAYIISIKHDTFESNKKLIIQ